MLRLRRPTKDQRGAIAVIVALTASALLVASAMVVDFGRVRMDRQLNKSATDGAIAAGLRAGDNGAGEVYTDRAVCGALSFLKANRRGLSTISDGLCAAPNNTKICVPGDATTGSSYAATVTGSGVTYKVWIKTPYLVSDATADGGAFTDELKATLASDGGNPLKQGCDQLGIVIKESTNPGLGSIVSSAPLVSRVRSVGRVGYDGGDQAPAMLLLERTKCSVLTVGSAGSPSRIKVFGSGTTPGTIHSDSAATGADCGSGSNQQLFQGKQADGIVAYGANGVSGSITSMAAFNNVAAAIISDATANVYGTTASSESPTGTTTSAEKRSQVKRTPVDVQYRTGLKAAITAAVPVWTLNSTTPGPTWTRVGCTPASLNPVPPAVGLYIDCPGGVTRTGSSTATKLFVNGWIKGGGMSFPNVTDVYINNPSGNQNAIDLGNNEAFCVRGTGCDATTPTLNQCSSTATLSATSKARVFVRDGKLKQTGGLLRMCNTTVIMMGGQTATGCIPNTNGIAPTATPCAGAAGTGQMGVNGGYQDWTAPNQYGGVIPAGSGERGLGRR